ncbi:unnamed protein product [Anisakis simplex]|uniref:DUF148 domain-containing protein n=1 Tax=Anisakis simplex TaxID=6269 RepID=A0A0M3K7Q4_ANISI|nr:unnamed protein product [Anisakis simplex]
MRFIIIGSLLVTAVIAAPTMSPSFALMPKFLKEAKPEAQQEFMAIVTDESLTINELEEKLNAWAAKQGGDVEKDYKMLEETAKKDADELNDAAESSSSLSQAAKDAFKHIDEIAADQNQTVTQLIKTIANYCENLPVSVLEEVMNFVGDKMNFLGYDDDE